MNGITHGPWCSAAKCRVCGHMARMMIDMDPCPQCGTAADHGGAQYVTVRLVRYSWTYCILSLLTGRGWPDSYWETK